MPNESVERARYRVRMARNNLRHAKTNVEGYRVELEQAKLALKGAKIQVRESRRARAHERSRSKGWLESKEHYAARMKADRMEGEY